ncbi:MAG: DUF302 domain-containing protein [Thermaerobacter sp.]|nr:DUF302 domain-containing protein [Thermaerobacter sp.]
MFKRTWSILAVLASGALLAGCGSPAATPKAGPTPAGQTIASAPAQGAQTVAYRSTLSMATIVHNLHAKLAAVGWTVVREFDVKTHLAKNKVQVPPSYLMEVLPDKAAAQAVAADPEAGLAFPLRVYLYQEGQATYASYLTPSSTLAAYGQSSLNSLGRNLDSQLGQMVRLASAGVAAPAPASDTPGQKIEVLTVAGLTQKQAVKNLDLEIGNHSWGVNNQQDLTKLAHTATGYEVEAFSGKLAGELMNADLPAGIEIPLRFYFYRQGGKLQLAYLDPSTIFARYRNPAASKLGRQLDATVSNMTVPVASGVTPGKVSGLGAGCG